VADRVSDQLRQALALARAGRTAEAAEALPPMTEASADHLPLLREASRRLNPSDALRPLAAILRLSPDDASARRSADAIWRADPAPGLLHADALPAVPADAACWQDPTASLKVVVLTPKRHLTLEPVRRDGTSGVFTATGAVYIRNGDRLHLAAVVRAQEGVPPETTARVARFCGVLWHVGEAFDAARGRPDGPVRVWLRTDGEPGCHTTGRDIVVGGATANRSALEWMRQLAHEWGHAVIPGVGGFREPESWANGDLGERLFLSAILRGRLAGAWDQPADVGAYVSRYVRPLIDAFARTGPAPSLVADTSRKGYEHFLGVALYVGETYGPDILAQALGSLAGERAADFLHAVAFVLGERRPVRAFRPDGVSGVRPICIPAPGIHILSGTGVRIAGRPVAGPVKLKAGWQMVEWTGTLSVTTQSDGRR
jgi:hypothetical protein